MNVDAPSYQLMHILTQAGRHPRLWFRRLPGKAAKDYAEAEAAMPYESVVLVGHLIRSSVATARRTRA